MKLNMYSIYDEAAAAYNAPFFMHNDGLAIRAFQDNVNSVEENNIAKHPAHFTLFKLGEYDDSNGMVNPQDAPKFLANAIELKSPTQTDDLMAELKTLKAYITNINTLKDI